MDDLMFSDDNDDMQIMIRLENLEKVLKTSDAIDLIINWKNVSCYKESSNSLNMW